MRQYSGKMVMQRATLIVRVTCAVVVGPTAVVNVVVMSVTHYASTAEIGGCILRARDRMLEMDGHQRQNTGELGDEKQPQLPAAEPTPDAQRNHAILAHPQT